MPERKKNKPFAPISVVVHGADIDPSLLAMTLRVLSSQSMDSVKLFHHNIGQNTVNFQQIDSSAWQTLYLSPHESTPGQRLNAVMAHTREEWVVFVDARAVADGPDFLASLLSAADSDAVGGLFPAERLADSPPDPAQAGELCARIGERLSGGWPAPLSPHCLAVRRNAWKKHAFNERLEALVEYEWADRLARDNLEVRLERAAILDVGYSTEDMDDKLYKEGQTLARLRALHPRLARLKLGIESWGGFLKRAPGFNTSLGRLPLAARLATRLKGIEDASRHPSVSMAAPDCSAITRGRYTAQPAPELEQAIDQVLDQIRSEVSETSFSPQALALTGVFAAREGLSLLAGNRVLPGEPIELAAIYEHPPGRGLAQDADRLADLVSRISADHSIAVDVQVFSERHLQKAARTLERYHLRRSGRMLLGDRGYLARFPDLRGGELPFELGERLFDRAVFHLLWLLHRPGAGIKTQPPDFAALRMPILAAGDAVLLRMGRYHFSRRERAQRLLAMETHGRPWLATLAALFAQASQSLDGGDIFTEHIPNVAALLAMMEFTHRWFVSTSFNCNDWPSYAAERLTPPRAWVSPLTLARSIRQFGVWPVSRRAAASLGLPLSERLNAVAPLLLYHIGPDGENHLGAHAQAITEALDMPRTTLLEGQSSKQLANAILARFFDLARHLEESE